MAKVKRFRGGGSSVAAAAPEDREPSRRFKSKPRPFTRTLETAEAGGNYPVKVNTPQVDTAGGNNIIKRPTSEVMSKASRAVEGELSGSLPRAASAGGASGNVYEGTASRIAKYVPKVGAASRILSGAGMALYPSELGDSSLSKSASEQAVKKGAFKQDQDSSTDAANSRAANREAMYGTQKTPEPSKPAKKDEPVAVVKKQTTVVSKPKGMSEGDRARAAIESMRGQYESGDLYNKAGIEKSSKDAAEMSKYIDSDKPEDLPANGLKKGGMTKRPPKPAKKVPARKFASGGSTSRTSASKRGDGCATKGHTKGKYL